MHSQDTTLRRPDDEISRAVLHPAVCCWSCDAPIRDLLGIASGGRRLCEFCALSLDDARGPGGAPFRDLLGIASGGRRLCEFCALSLDEGRGPGGARRRRWTSQS